MNILLKEARRLVNRLIGVGPYDLIPFSDILDEAHNEMSHGIDHPESTTGILYQENTKWVKYSRPTLSLTEKVSSRTVVNQTRYLEKGIFSEPPRIVYSLSNGGVAGNNGLVYDAKKRLAIKETVHNWTFSPRYQSVLLSPRFPPPIHLEGLTLSIVTLGAEGFYHFFHESLPRLFLSRFLLDSIDYILINSCGEEWKTSWLKQIGIPIEKVIWIDGLSHYRCEQIIFVSDTVANEQPNSWSVTALRSLLGARSSQNKDRWIWASRSDATSRQLSWENEMLNLFPKFEKVCFSKLSPKETISICSECKVFAGPHGAAFSNIVFCNSETLIIEFSPSCFKSPCFTRLADLCNLQHATLVADFDSLPDNLADLKKAMDFFVSSVDSTNRTDSMP